MSIQTCTDHGNEDAVVVYQGGWMAQCPFCAALQKIEDLKQQIEDLEGERDSLLDEVSALRGGKT